MLEILGQSIGAILAGGATGLLGSVISMFGAYRKVKQQHRHEEKMQELATKSMEIEAKLKLDQTVVEGDIKESLAALETLRASYDHDKATYFKGTGVKVIDGFVGLLFGLIDFVRGMIRPAITGFMAIVVVRTHEELVVLRQDMNVEFSAEQVYLLYSNLNNIMLYVATTVILWWFGTRYGEKTAERLAAKS